MNLNFENYNIKNNIKCDCGRDFDIHDITKLEPLNQHGFYGGIVNNFSHAVCPVCHRKAILLLLQKGQTWEILNIAVPKEQVKTVAKPINVIKKNETVKDTVDTVDTVNDGLTCSICGKVCKSKSGLTAHMRTHNK